MTIREDIIPKIVKIAWCRALARGKTRNNGAVLEAAAGGYSPKPKLIHHENVMSMSSGSESSCAFRSIGSPLVPTRDDLGPISVRRVFKHVVVGLVKCSAGLDRYQFSRSTVLLRSAIILTVSDGEVVHSCSACNTSTLGWKLRLPQEALLVCCGWF